eukprot:scaffold5514_cov139-Skeletonema_menzelii.AAC.1
MSGSDSSNGQAGSLLASELFDFCKSESLSEGGLREIIKRHGLTPNNNHVSDYKFFLSACINERVNEEIIRCLLEYFPDAVGFTNKSGCSPLHAACYNKSTTLNIIRLLIDAAPDSVRNVTNNGIMPLHMFCNDAKVDEAAAIQILKLLIGKYPEAVRHMNNNGFLPIHLASRGRSPEFCRVLIEAFPGSERITNVQGVMPLHVACVNNTIPTVEYMYRLYPDAINNETPLGYPIHRAIFGTQHREDPAAAVEIVQFMLDCDPNVKLQKCNGVSLLNFACQMKYNDSNIEAGIQIIKVILDAHPDSVRNVTNNGIMPLHCLCNNAKVDEAAAIQILKLLIGKYPEAVRHTNNNGRLPIHFASLRRSPEFCRMLIEAYPGSEQIPDHAGTLPLHYACSLDNVATFEYFFNLYPDAINHATTNGHYPIHYALMGMKHRENPAAAVETVRFLLSCDPNVKLQKCNGKSLLHFACGDEYNDSNIEAGIQVIKVILDAHPDSIRSVTNEGDMPLHMLCNNIKVDEAAAIQILKLLIGKYPEAVRHTNNNGRLPIHIASWRRSPEFCRVLIEAFPGSERITNANGALPLHVACENNTVPTVKYLHRQYPDAINNAKTNGQFPIHAAIMGAKHRDDPAAAVETVQFLLDCDPNQKLKQCRGRPLLNFACQMKYNDSNIEAGIQIIKVLFDAHPQSIEDNSIASNIHRWRQEVQDFINREIVYARQAKDLRLLTKPDEDGRLPLHKALQNNVRLGSIKLLVKGNPSAIRNVDSNFAMPLHVACQHHDSTSVIQYLLDLDMRTLRAVDIDNNTALHHACRGAKYDNISLLLEKYDALSVSKQNVHGKLPINLLWESDAVEDRESVEYTESIFRLLRAYPEMVMTSNTKMKRPASADADATQVRKRRKLCDSNNE